MTASIKAIQKLGPLEMGSLLDVKDVITNQWKEATIISADYFKIKVHFINEQSQYKDAWIHCDNELSCLEKHGTFTKRNNDNYDNIILRTSLSDKNYIDDYHFAGGDENNGENNRKTINDLQNKVKTLENKLSLISKQNNSNDIHLINELTLENKNLKDKIKKMSLEIENLENIVQQLQTNEEWEEITD